MSGPQLIPKGEYIFREGETARYAYVLQTGVVDIVKIGSEGEKVLFELDQKNQIFGEMTLIDGQPRSAGAKAKTDVTVSLVDGPEFLDYVAKQPTAALNIMKKLSSDLRQANQLNSNIQRNQGDEDTDYSDAFTVKIKQTNGDIQDTDAIYETPPSKPLMYSAVILLLLLCSGFTFASIFALDTTVSSRGMFTTKMPNVDVQASTNAVVKKILVERGQVLKKNQIVAILDEIDARANLIKNTETLAAVEARLLRIRLEEDYIRNDQTIPKNINLSPLLSDILRKKVGQYRSKMSTFMVRIGKLEKEVITTEEDIKFASLAITIAKEQRDLKQQMESAKESLYKKKVVSLLAFLESREKTLSAKKTYNDSINQYNQKKATLAAKKPDLSILKSDKEEFILTWSSKLSEERSSEEDKRGQLIQENVKLMRDMENVEVRTAVAGVILDIPKVSAGSIVSKGDTIVTLVRINQPLTLEVDVMPKDISDVRIGSSTSVKLDALPFQQYGDLKGKLSYLSQDTYDKSLSGEDGAFYRGRVDVPISELTSLPPDFKLTSGMTASADMKVGERLIITYLLNPIIKGLSLAFREPD
jgi:hemolysin D